MAESRKRIGFTLPADSAAIIEAASVRLKLSPTAVVATLATLYGPSLRIGMVPEDVLRACRGLRGEGRKASR